MPDASPNRDSLVVLVHGAWHGAWCWASLQADLESRGIASLAVDLPGHGASTLPLTDMHGDAQHLVDVLAALDRNVVLVGHSYGGAVITEAASRSSGIAHLVYVAAFALEQGETIMSLLASLPRADVALSAAMVPDDNGVATIDPAKARAALYGSCSDEVVRAALPRLSPQPLITFGQPVTGDPRASIASTYIACTLDQAISYSHQQVMAQRCTSTVTLATDHSPFASMTSATADVIAGLMTNAGVGAAS